MGGEPLVALDLADTLMTVTEPATDLIGTPGFGGLVGTAVRKPRERLGLLRRCANPTCSMLFLAENKRRKWCTSNICGKRARVARHYERTHTDGVGGI